MVVQSNLVNVSDTSTSVAHCVGLYLYLLLNWINESLRLVGSWPTPAVPTLHYTQRERELVDVWTTSKAVASTPGTVSNSSWYPNTISAAKMKMKMKITKTNPQHPQKKQQKDAGVGFLRACVFLFCRVDFFGFLYNKEKEHTAGSQERKRERAICDDGMTRDDDENSDRIISNSLSLSLFYFSSLHHTRTPPLDPIIDHKLLPRPNRCCRFEGRKRRESTSRPDLRRSMVQNAKWQGKWQ